MIEFKITNCKKCAKEIFLHKDGECVSSYEDLSGTTLHTKLRCEINQVVSKQLGQLQIQINQIKERLNL